MAHRIYDTLKVDGHPMGILAGDMDIQARSEAIARFRKGQDRLLITTNVSARGTTEEMLVPTKNRADRDVIL